MLLPGARTAPDKCCPMLVDLNKAPCNLERDTLRGFEHTLAGHADATRASYQSLHQGFLSGSGEDLLASGMPAPEVLLWK